jgi:type IV pilus assembly protein PilV
MKLQLGFAMLEVLITMVILALGMLGLAGLQNTLLIYEIESYQRSQALLIQQDMVERIGVNRKQATEYADKVRGGSGTVPTCTGSGVERDLCEWDRLLKGATEVKGGANIGTISGAVGCIDDLGNGQYRVSVAWQGFNTTQAPVTMCGQNQFGAEELRRTITSVVRIANLSCDPAVGSC